MSSNDALVNYANHWQSGGGVGTQQAHYPPPPPVPTHTHTHTHTIGDDLSFFHALVKACATWQKVMNFFFLSLFFFLAC